MVYSNFGVKQLEQYKVYSNSDDKQLNTILYSSYDDKQFNTIVLFQL